MCSQTSVHEEHVFFKRTFAILVTINFSSYCFKINKFTYSFIATACIFLEHLIESPGQDVSLPHVELSFLTTTGS